MLDSNPNPNPNPNPELISRQHARLSYDQASGTWYADDMASDSGTTVNGEPVVRAAIKPGDVIRLGGVDHPQSPVAYRVAVKDEHEHEPKVAHDHLSPNPNSNPSSNPKVA